MTLSAVRASTSRNWLTLPRSDVHQTGVLLLRRAKAPSAGNYPPYGAPHLPTPPWSPGPKATSLKRRCVRPCLRLGHVANPLV